MENTIPTAEEFLGNQSQHLSILITPFMRQFAQMHVEAALEAAANSIDCQKCYYEESSQSSVNEIEKQILASYPLENIK